MAATRPLTKSWRRFPSSYLIVLQQNMQAIPNPSDLPLKSHKGPARFCILGALAISIQLGTGQDVGSPKPPRIPDRWRIECERELYPGDRNAQFKLANVQIAIHTQAWYVAVCDGASILVGTGRSASVLGAQPDWTTNTGFEHVAGFDLKQYWVVQNQTDLRLASADEKWDVESPNSLPLGRRKSTPPRHFVELSRSIVEEVVSMGIKNVDLRTLVWSNNQFTASTITGHALAGQATDFGPNGITQLVYFHIGTPETKYVVRLSYDRRLECTGFPSTIRRSILIGEVQRPEVAFYIHAFRPLTAVESAQYRKSPPFSRCLTNGTILLYTNNSTLKLSLLGGKIIKLRTLDPRLLPWQASAIRWRGIEQIPL